MIQVLPGVPTFGNRLGAALGEAGGDVAGGFAQRSQNRALQGLVENIPEELKPLFQSLVKSGGIKSPAVAALITEAAKGIQAQANAPKFDQQVPEHNAFTPGINPPQMEPPAIQGQTPLKVEASQKSWIPERPRRNEADPSSWTAEDIAAAKLSIGKLKGLGEKEEKDREKARTANLETAEPYKDLSHYRQRVGKTKRAVQLIDSGKVSLDSNKLRTAIGGFLEGKFEGAEEAFKTKEQQEIISLLRDEIKSKELGGTNPNAREFGIAMQSIVSNLKGQAANEAIGKRLEQEAETELFRGETVRDLLKARPDLPPEQFNEIVDRRVAAKQEQLAKEFDDYLSKAEERQALKTPAPSGYVYARNPQGELRELPKDKVSAAQAKGWQIVSPGK